MKRSTAPTSLTSGGPRRYDSMAFGVTEGPMTGDAGYSGAAAAGADI